MPSSERKLTRQLSATFVWTHTINAAQCLLGLLIYTDPFEGLERNMAVQYGIIASVLNDLQVDSFQYQKYTYAKTLKFAHYVTD